MLFDNIERGFIVFIGIRSKEIEVEVVSSCFFNKRGDRVEGFKGVEFVFNQSMGRFNISVCIRGTRRNISNRGIKG